LICTRPASRLRLATSTGFRSAFCLYIPPNLPARVAKQGCYGSSGRGGGVLARARAPLAQPRPTRQGCRPGQGKHLHSLPDLNFLERQRLIQKSTNHPEVYPVDASRTSASPDETFTLVTSPWLGRFQPHPTPKGLKAFAKGFSCTLQPMCSFPVLPAESEPLLIPLRL